MGISSEDLTQLLAESSRGGKPALDRLMPVVYEELKRLAGKYLRREGGDATLEPTSLVHEAYLRMVDQNRASWQDRTHFFRVAAQVMRRVLVDHYRTRRAKKRGGGGLKVTLASEAAAEPVRELDVLALDRALSALGRLDREQTTIVELRFFAGLTVEETAQALGISPATVKREWAMARAWILLEIQGGARAAAHGT